jgi:hypothetical protein
MSYTLAASAARTASATGDGVDIKGYWNKALLYFDVTDQATEVGDTLDVYVDVSPDGGTTWINAAHFTQVVGNGSASSEIAVLNAATPGTSTVVVTASAAAAAVRPMVFGNQMRARWAITDTGTDNASFTFSVTAFVQ